MEERIAYTRKILDNLVSAEDANLSEGKILEVSRELDMLIANYYKEDSFII